MNAKARTHGSASRPLRSTCFTAGLCTVGALCVLALSACSESAGAPAGVDTSVEVASPTEDEATPAACRVDADCDATAGACEAWRCAAGECSLGAAEEGTACDDGLTCTTGDACTAGTCTGAPGCADTDLCDGEEACTPEGCVAGSPLLCDNGDPCDGLERCAPATGCLAGTPVECTDGDPCNGVETCSPGSGCAAAEVASCDDADPCTDDHCQASVGCVSVPNGQAGCCSSAADCNDDNPCTSEHCDAGGVCVFAHTEAVCSDGDACTTGDSCEAGVCVGAEASGCQRLCAGSLDDLGEATCTIGLAAVDPSAPATRLAMSLGTTASWLGPLVERRCWGATCASVPRSTGGAWGSTGHALALEPATFGELWKAGRVEWFPLQGEAPLGTGRYAGDVLSGNAHLATLEVHGTPNAPFEVVLHDASAAAGAEALSVSAVPVSTLGAQTGVILATAPPNCGEALCFDGRPCISAACEGGSCVASFDAGDCDDGDACSLVEQCDGLGHCVASLLAPAGTTCLSPDLCAGDGACDALGTCVIPSTSPPPCSGDFGPCAQATCDPGTGSCSVVLDSGAPCDDGDACTVADQCDSVGSCAGLSLTCDDGVACTVDACDAGGLCTHAPDASTCEDGNDCTSDSCDAASGCKHVVVVGPCDDGDPCTDLDACGASGCQGQPGFGCGCDSLADCAVFEDGNRCNGTLHCKDSLCRLDPASVVTCPYAGVDCTTDWVCAPETGECSGQAKNCDDGDPCTSDVCHDTLGCVSALIVGCADNWICEVSGPKGAAVTCAIRLEGLPLGSIDLHLTWDAALRLTRLTDNLCFGPTCFDYDLVSCSPEGGGCITEALATGHSLSLAPAQQKDWTTWLTAFVYHVGAPGTPLTSGGPALIKAEFVLDAPVANTRIAISDMAGKSPVGEPRVLSVDTTAEGRVIAVE